MHLYKVVVRIYRLSDGVSMRPDKPNTLTCQIHNTNDTPRNLLLGPVTSYIQAYRHIYMEKSLGDRTLHFFLMFLHRNNNIIRKYWMG